ncbi:glycerophosphodiester phosphodiesterase [Ancylomarina salipaludis]|uniref:Glycerophosphodiester phosphodiesterase n=1 Tax=Ancylomarina salipaludis TaxID=2501299 RepID=A0A4Q1JPN9_9BACT|nr:glycerophosphodiester phosphodiesterase family protein [Ancylomarina salipaludis]RXQ97344.1 glycerophosphodiester phosphodiesterase [Ancylomarina salipaludis]
MKSLNVRNLLAGALILTSIGFAGCEDDTPDYNPYNLYKTYPLNELSAEAKIVRDYVKPDAVIAHRGSTFWAPEETEAAFRWARNMGADYLEIDLQRTKDGVLLALHDGNLRRTSNIESIFPGKEDYPVSVFTLKQLRQLDAGSWFNIDKPENARASFVGLQICTLKDVLLIAEGMKVKRNSEGKPYYKKADGTETLVLEDSSTGEFVFVVDNDDNGNRPGVYAETKEPYLFSGMEADLAAFLTDAGWNITDSPKTIATTPGKVAVGNTNGRFILQTFSRESVVKLEKELPGVPKCMLLWEDESAAYVRPSNSIESLAEFINFSVEYNCHIAGPSIAGKPNGYPELTEPWMCEMYHRAGMLVHAYSFDTEDQLRKYNGDYFYAGVSRFDNPARVISGDFGYDVNPNMFIDGGFTNLTDLSMKYQNREVVGTAQEVMNDLGY